MRLRVWRPRALQLGFSMSANGSLVAADRSSSCIAKRQVVPDPDLQDTHKVGTSANESQPTKRNNHYCLARARVQF
jgi:hypothetical protein